MKYRTAPPESYADKLSWVKVTPVPAVGVRVDPDERDLFCGKCGRWTSHVFVGDVWLCYTSECGGYVPETSIKSQKEFDELAESFEFEIALGE